MYNEIHNFIQSCNLIDFLKNKFTGETCGADYPYYCGTASAIIGVYLHNKYKIDAELIACKCKYVEDTDEGKKGELEIQNVCKIIIDNVEYIVDPTVFQFGGKERIEFVPMQNSNYYDSEEVHLFTIEELNYLYRDDWNKYLENIYNHRNILV